MSDTGQISTARVSRLERMVREYRAVIRDLPLGVVGLDFDGRCVFANQSARTFLGAASDRFDGRPLLKAVLAHELRTVLGEQIDLARDGYPTTRAVDFGGRALEIRSIVPAEIDRVSSLMLTIEDVTWRRRAERQKEEFLSLVSHELRTPLTVIKGYLDIFDRGMMGEMTAQQRDTTRIMLDQCGKLENLIHELIRFRCLTRGPDGICPQPVAMLPFLSQLAAEVDARVREAGMALVLDVRGGDVTCWCDACQLRDVMLQIIDNAVKFAADGKTLRVSAREVPSYELAPPQRRLVALEPKEDSRWVIVEVADDGPGMPAGELERLFESFHQGEEHLTRRIRGLGIGLAVVRRVVDLNGGTLWVDSEAGRGTTVCLALPLLDADVRL